MKHKKQENQKRRKSSMPYKISTTKIGDLIQAQARKGNPKAQMSAEKFLKACGGETDEQAVYFCGSK